MPVQMVHIAPAVQFCFAAADRFKSSSLLFQMALPLQQGQTEAVACGAILPYLLHRSCAALPTPRQLERVLAELYGASLQASVQKIGESQVLSISLTTIDERFVLTNESVSRGGIAILLELLFYPLLQDGLFPAATLELEKRLLLEQLESQEGNKWAYSNNQFCAHMCHTEAYGLNPLGTKQSVAALTPQSVTAFWQTALQTAPMQFTTVANGGQAEVADLLRSHFAGRVRNPIQLSTVFVPTATAVRRFSESQAIEQAKLWLGFRTGTTNPTQNEDALRLMVTLWGGAPCSKLFLQVREKQSLCYQISASFARQKGLAFVRAGIETEKAAETEAAICHQLQCICNGDFSDEELEMSRDALIDSWNSIEDLPEDIAGWYAAGLITNEFQSPGDYVTRIQAVTREQVVAAARACTLDSVYLLATEKEVQA